MDWPKCEECEGRGTIIDQLCPAHDYGDPGYPPAECGFCERKPCPACNGTGEAKELTVGQAGDFIKSVYGADWYLRPETMRYDHPHGPAYVVVYNRDVRIGEGQSIPEALNAAARAARESGRGKECD